MRTGPRTNGADNGAGNGAGNGADNGADNGAALAITTCERTSSFMDNARHSIGERGRRRGWRAATAQAAYVVCPETGGRAPIAIALPRRSGAIGG